MSRRPECPVLLGAVSVSNDYTAQSRNLLVSFLEASRPKELARLVRQRRPYRQNPFSRPQTATILRFLRDLDELSDPISDLEADGKSIPVLIRQYMKLGGRVLAFNLDPGFANALDGLIVVDLRQTPLAALERYMSRQGAASFLSYHRRRCA